MITRIVVALGLTAAAVNAVTYNECKHYKFCCDNDVCNNNCARRPTCEWNLPPQGVPYLPIAISICESFFQYECCRDANGCGDPHFQTWNGEWFDFHGECDLNFVHAPQFGHDLGLDVHVRTKIRSDFSYIESAAVKIGDDVLVVGGWGEVLYNGVQVPKTELPKNVGSFPLTHDTIDEATHNYHINLGGESQNLLIKSFKDYVSVKFENAAADNFLGSTGLLGDFLTGNRLARDGYSVMENDIEYGMEWQVRPDEPTLFQSSEMVPQWPQKCNMPPLTADGRRLAEAKVADDVAEAACAHMEDEAHKRMCVYDIQATGDLSMAKAGVF